MFQIFWIFLLSKKKKKKEAKCCVFVCVFYKKKEDKYKFYTILWLSNLFELLMVYYKHLYLSIYRLYVYNINKMPCHYRLLRLMLLHWHKMNVNLWIFFLFFFSLLQFTYFIHIKLSAFYFNYRLTKYLWHTQFNS